MGICNSSLNAEERKYIAASQKWDRDLQRDHVDESSVVKLLFLGTGESGKSTLLKQMVILYGNGFQDMEKQSFRPVVIRNVVESMQVLLKEMERTNRTGELSDECVKYGHEINEAELWSNNFWDPKYIPHIEALWAQPVIKDIFENRSSLQIMDSVPYFFDRIRTVGVANYTPDQEDILRARLRTSGIVEKQLTIHKQLFTFVDVGGQRNERRKWIHCFDSVTSIVFVVAISEYDQLLFEDNRTNRLIESLETFRSTTNNEYFTNTPMILFFNKIDLFGQKLPRVPLQNYLKEYTGASQNVEEASNFIIAMFENVSERNKLVFSHLTCATDTGNVQRVFDSCRLVILRNNLNILGLQ